MHDAVAESRTEPHREPTMKTLVDDAKILTTCTQHNTITTPQHHNNTTTHQHPPMLAKHFTIIPHFAANRWGLSSYRGARRPVEL
jgi:hypothetical protein